MEWLAITRAFHAYMPTGPNQLTYPEENTVRAAVAKELTWVQQHVKTLRVEECQTFVITAPPPSDGENPSLRYQQRRSRCRCSSMRSIKLYLTRLPI